jgi:tetratricopeptide (TPR) repeat protein
MTQHGMKQIRNKNELVDQIYRLMEQRDFQNAGKLCEQVTTRFPDFAEGWVAAAEFFLRVTKPQRALELALKAIRLDPENSNWMLLHARCLMECGNTQQMQDIVAKVAAKRSLTPHQHNELGMLLARIDDHAQAQDHYRLAVMALPGEIEFLFNLATSQRFLGDVKSAEKTLDKILSIDPTDHEAAAMRSSLRKQTADNNHVDKLKSTLASASLSPAGQVSFCYALAKELEDLEKYRESFAYLERGAKLRKSGMSYSVSTDVEIIQQIIRVFDAGFFAERRRGHESVEPLFIIGLPRSGTTLLERILGSHSKAYAAGELGHFGIELTKLTRQKMGAVKADRGQFITASAEIDFEALGGNYVQSTRPLTGHTAHFIDKLPFNYLYAGLIHQALPGARIISLRRHPMDSCYSMYKQLFRDAYPFSYSQQDLAEYYIAYHQLMAHWENMMPGVIHTVCYEDLVNNTEGEARRVLAHCGLDWEEQCLDFHKSTAASTTASATQVRQKVYTSSVGKWRTYETELMPLRQKLEAAGISL